MEYKVISFKATPLNSEIFNRLAEQVAESFVDRSSNKHTQLRKFYDELLYWNEEVQINNDSFQTLLPFIKMMIAKVAYSRSRKLVNDNFYSWFSHCTGEVVNPETLLYFKLHFEAMLGFYKAKTSQY